MKKIAFVVQQYGIDVNGGAEYFCRILAERLTKLYDITVLTSCAIDYQTWANYYPSGVSYSNNVRVLRFPTASERQPETMAFIYRKIQKWTQPEERSGFGFFRLLGRALTGKTVKQYGALWVKNQGPYLPDLPAYLKENHKQYDALVFFTYLYYPTVEGMNIAPRKSILIPTAHDEPAIHIPIFRRVFRSPRAILFLTLGERRFVHRQFQNQSIYNDIIGIGIEPPRVVSERSTVELIGTDADYLLYIGRVDVAKGCDKMCEQFIRYKKKYPSSLKLVLVGQSFMTIPNHPDIIPAGFVDEDVKARLLMNAKALLMPSPYESLSMVTLESMAVGVPVIANADCEILRDHIESSQAGYAYHTYTELETAITNILMQDVSKMAENGRQYVQHYYTWQTVLDKFAKAIDYAASKK